jgi:hypothetical protein
LDKNIEFKMDNSKSNYKFYNTEPCSASVINKKYYVIEGVDSEGDDFENNFFNKLKCMTQSNESIENVNIDSCCLLTKEALNDIFVTLKCGHKFNYIPLYREIVIQKTSAGITSNGYYNSCTLRLNEVKCPYCRRIQDKLLPFLNYDDVKRLRGVNSPESLCMKARMCEHIETANNQRKNSKKKTSDSCECNAIHVVNGAYYCKKHYEQQPQKQEQQEENKEESSSSFITTESENVNVCGVIIKTGIKKGLPCTSSSKCRIHAHLRKNVIVATCVD